MRTIYIAYDGTQFTDEFACELYEWDCAHPHLKTILAFDQCGSKLSNLMDEDTYYSCEKLIIPTIEAVQDLSDLAEFTGFTSYGDITKPGVWQYDDDEAGFVFVQE